MDVSDASSDATLYSIHPNTRDLTIFMGAHVGSAGEGCNIALPATAAHNYDLHYNTIVRYQFTIARDLNYTVGAFVLGASNVARVINEFVRQSVPAYSEVKLEDAHSIEDGALAAAAAPTVHFLYRAQAEVAIDLCVDARIGPSPGGDACWRHPNMQVCALDDYPNATVKYGFPQVDPADDDRMLGFSVLIQVAETYQEALNETVADCTLAHALRGAVETRDNIALHAENRSVAIAHAPSDTGDDDLTMAGLCGPFGCELYKGTFLHDRVGTFFSFRIDAVRMPVRYGKHTSDLRVRFRHDAADLGLSSFCGDPDLGDACEAMGRLADSLRTPWAAVLLVIVGETPLACLG